MTMIETTVTPELVGVVVGLLARGNGISRTAAKTKLGEGVVRRIGEQHGYPDMGRLEAASQRLNAAQNTPPTQWAPVAPKPPQKRATPPKPPAPAPAEDIGGALTALAEAAEKAVENLLEGLDRHTRNAATLTKISELEAEIARLRAEIDAEPTKAAPEPAPKPAPPAPKPRNETSGSATRTYPEGVCPRGHDTAKTGRYTSTGQCCECVLENGRASRAAKKQAQEA